jgi:N-acetylmuramoyl-L-alanine amidase
VTTAQPARGPRLIREGDAGPAVRDVQRRLKRVAAPDLSVDATFGARTLEAVRRFQRERGLDADGIVGPHTWRELVEAGWSLGDRLLWQSRRMLRGDDVRDLQHRLNQLGFDAGPEDGIFGPLLRAAVEEFQRNVGIDVDGVAGPETVGALRRLRREHQSGGLGIRAREREAMRRLVTRGLVGTRILVDPSHGAGDDGHAGPSGLTEPELSWDIATRLVGLLGGQGAQALLSRGPRNAPSGSERARLANEQGVDLVVSVAFNGVGTTAARGAAAYYFGAPHFVSEAGRRLADLLLEEVVTAGWQPDCRVHPMTWPILRETRMPAVVIEPAFVTCPADERRLRDPSERAELAIALVGGIARFLRQPFPAEAA